MRRIRPLCGSKLVAKWIIKHPNATARETNALEGRYLDQDAFVRLDESGTKISEGMIHAGRHMVASKPNKIFRELQVSAAAAAAAQKVILSQSSSRKSPTMRKNAAKNAPRIASEVENELNPVMKSKPKPRKKRKDATKGKIASGFFDTASLTPSIADQTPPEPTAIASPTSFDIALEIVNRDFPPTTDNDRRMNELRARDMVARM